MPAWETHLNVAQTGRINAFLKNAYKMRSFGWGGAPHSGAASATGLYNKMQHSAHCIHNLLTSIKALEYSLRNSQVYTLPQCKCQLVV